MKTRQIRISKIAYSVFRGQSPHRPASFIEMLSSNMTDCIIDKLPTRPIKRKRPIRLSISEDAYKDLVNSAIQHPVDCIEAIADLMRRDSEFLVELTSAQHIRSVEMLKRHIASYPIESEDLMLSIK